MAMTLDELNDLDDDLMVDDDSQQQQHAAVWDDDEPEDDEDVFDNDNDTPDNEDEDQDEESDVLSDYLKSKGINRNSIKITNDEGVTEEVAFDNLTREEQMEILNYDPSNPDFSLEDDEKELLNSIRDSRLTVDEYLADYRNKVINEYLENNQDEPSYKIDEYSDEDLFLADLKKRIPDITEAEAVAQLQLEQQNPTLFAKKVNGIRADYKQKEDEYNRAQQEEATRAQKEQAEQFEKVIVDTLQRNDTIDFGDSSIELSEDDMNDVASFILDSDAAGVRYIAKALNDPKTLIQMAWWAMKGPEALNQISQYYKKQISDAGKANYAKGYEDARSGKAPKTVVKKPASKPASRRSNNNQRVMTIDDLY